MPQRKPDLRSARIRPATSLPSAVRRPITHTGYLNNYRQARAMRLLSGTEFIDGGFFLMRPGADKEGPLSEIACTSYESVGSVERLLRERDGKYSASYRRRSTIPGGSISDRPSTLR